MQSKSPHFSAASNIYFIILSILLLQFFPRLLVFLILLSNYNNLLLGIKFKCLFFSFPKISGLPPDSPFNPDLHPSRRDQAHHLSRQKPTAAPVWSEELRVRLPHPWGGPQRSCVALQQLVHPVPENIGEWERGENHDVMPFKHCNCWRRRHVVLVVLCLGQYHKKFSNCLHLGKKRMHFVLCIYKIPPTLSVIH